LGTKGDRNNGTSGSKRASFFFFLIVVVVFLLGLSGYLYIFGFCQALGIIEPSN